MRPCRALAGAAVPSAPGQDERRPGVIRGSPKNTSRDGSLRGPPGASSAAPANPLSGSGRGLSARGQILAAYQSVRPWCDTSATVSSSSRRCFVRKRSVSNHRLIADRFRPCDADLGGVTQANPKRQASTSTTPALLRPVGGEVTRIECLAVETRTLPIGVDPRGDLREEAAQKSRKLAYCPSAALDNPAAAVS